MPETMKLEPCPFCQGTHVCLQSNVGARCTSDHAWVACNICGADGPECASEAEAVAAWNRRPAQQSEPVAWMYSGPECLTNVFLRQQSLGYVRAEVETPLYARPPADHELTPTTVDARETSDDEVEVGKFSANETALLASSVIIGRALASHDEAIRTATGFEGIERAADEEDRIMAELPSLLRLCELVANDAVDQRAAIFAMKRDRTGRGAIVAWLRGVLTMDRCCKNTINQCADAIERGQHMGSGKDD